MTHHDIEIDDYHEGDAIELELTIETPAGETVDLTGAEIEWLLKDTALDDDADALLVKDSAVSSDEVDLHTPSAGQATVIVDTGDTTGLLTDEDGSRTVHHRARVTTAAGDRVTLFHGDFVIHQ